MVGRKTSIKVDKNLVNLQTPVLLDISYMSMFDQNKDKYEVSADRIW